MNLRSFHAFLIVMAAALAALFGVWCLRVYFQENGAGSLVAAIVAFAIAVSLVIYDRWFLRKTRALR